MIRTMPNEQPLVPTAVEHVLDIPACCPVSGNPRPGSRLTIRYCPSRTTLEVYSLKQYLAGYVGGKGDIRAMEAMVQQIVVDCRDALGVEVEVIADLVLEPEQVMRVTCRLSWRTLR